jgi:hypothetical protein
MRYELTDYEWAAGCARISMMAKSTNAPLKGRIQKRKTMSLEILRSHLQHPAGP